jgi:hypothetical protein
VCMACAADGGEDAPGERRCGPVWPSGGTNPLHWAYQSGIAVAWCGRPPSRSGLGGRAGGLVFEGGLIIWFVRRLQGSSDERPVCEDTSDTRRAGRVSSCTDSADTDRLARTAFHSDHSFRAFCTVAN